MQGFQVRAATIIGRDHMFRQANCQDAYAFVESNEYIFGLVTDGCGEGAHSEVGAKLLAKFVVEEINLLLASGVSIKEIPSVLFPHCLEFLRRLSFFLEAPVSREKTKWPWLWLDHFSPSLKFVKNYLLCTILGFVMDETQGIIFAVGDGLIIINEEMIVRDEEDKPNYIAYHLVDEQFLEKADQLPEKFDVYQFEVGNLEHLAIATDGFESELVKEIWGHTHPRGLQRKFNLWSREKHFQDDSTIIVVERR